MNVEYSEAIAEVLDILQHTEPNLLQSIPKKLMELWKTHASKEYQANLDYTQPIEEMPLKPKTKALIGMIYRNYWCTTEERKKYDTVLKHNEAQYQESVRTEYSSASNILTKTVSDLEEVTEEKNIIPYKENIFVKIFHKIQAILKK